MYWTAIVVEPTYTLIREAQETQETIIKNGETAVEQNHLLIENQNTNTEKLENIIANQSNIIDNQIVLIRDIDNATSKLGIILDFFRKNFNETFLQAESLERDSTQDILGNVTQIRDILLIQEVKVNQTLVDMLIEQEMRKWIDEMRENLSSTITTIP